MKAVFCAAVMPGTVFGPIKEKEKVLEYLKSGEHYCASARAVTDRVTGELTGLEDNWKTDGVYCWSEDTVYHFEAHNLPLPNEFIVHVMKN